MGSRPNLQKIKKCYKCGNLKNFLSICFHVKSEWHKNSASLILRVIMWGHFRVSKIAIFCSFLLLWILILDSFTPRKNAKFHQVSKFRVSKNVKMAVFESVDSLKLILRKIWVVEKSWNSHTVYNGSIFCRNFRA